MAFYILQYSHFPMLIKYITLLSNYKLTVGKTMKVEIIITKNPYNFYDTRSRLSSFLKFETETGFRNSNIWIGIRLASGTVDKRLRSVRKSDCKYFASDRGVRSPAHRSTWVAITLA